MQKTESALDIDGRESNVLDESKSIPLIEIMQATAAASIEPNGNSIVWRFVQNIEFLQDDGKKKRIAYVFVSLTTTKVVYKGRCTPTRVVRRRHSCQNHAANVHTHVLLNSLERQLLSFRNSDPCHHLSSLKNQEHSLISPFRPP